jgi:putative membrane protein
MDGDWGWWMVVGWFWMVAFWGIVIWGVVALVQRSNRQEPPAPREDDALTILERRYARGELSAEEFEGMRRTLRSR